MRFLQAKDEDVTALERDDCWPFTSKTRLNVVLLTEPLDDDLRIRYLLPVQFDARQLSVRAASAQRVAALKTFFFRAGLEWMPVYARHPSPS